MANLRINKLNYYGDQYYFESKVFDSNIVIIEADNGTGKTTLCELIYFGLGGKVDSFLKSGEEPHEQIVNDKNNHVDLYISINTKNYLVQRHIGKNDIIVSEYTLNGNYNEFDVNILESTTNIFTVHRNKNNNMDVFSDWILNALNIDVVSLYQGSTTFKFNFTDLFRLIYHNQLPDPQGIYKQLDTKTNFISDSELIRKAIFELLIGNRYSKLYNSIKDEREAEQKYQISKGLVDEYTKLISNLSEDNCTGNIVNLDKLRSEVSESENSLNKLMIKRDKITNSSLPTGVQEDQLNILKAKFSELESDNIELKKKSIYTISEKNDLKDLLEQRNQDIRNVEKVIHTHNNLSLFNSNTCLHCLEDVAKLEGHCICGTALDDASFEQFTYTSNEYIDILKSRIKSKETIYLAYYDCERELKSLTNSIHKNENELIELKETINNIITSIGYISPSSEIIAIDNKIFALKEKISSLNQMVLMEEKLSNLTDDMDNHKGIQTIAASKKKINEANAEIDMKTKIDEFNEIYNSLMKKSLDECRNAKISPLNYMPMINNGSYREASSKVPTRLMYYLALLKISLANPSVAFPKFLLIDTPETSGIEIDNLLKCFEQFKNIKGSYQVIISTGLDKYPPEFLKYRKLFLPDKRTKLLKKYKKLD